MLFRRAAGFGWRTLSLSILMIGLMFADLHYRYLNTVRNVLSVALTPLQYALSAPIDALEWLQVSAATQHQLSTENTQLKQQVLLMQVKLQQLINMQEENSQLRALLKSSERITGQFQEAKLLAINLEVNSDEMILDKGAEQGVTVGQIVIDVSGIMGQVISVTPFTSRVLLISDPRSGIPVQDDRSGFQAMILGMGTERPLSLIHVSETADVKVGDLLLTSGLGMRYPEGYPVGVVEEIEKTSGEPFMDIKVRASAQLSQSRRVLLVRHDFSVEQRKRMIEAGLLPYAEKSSGAKL